MAEKQQRSAFKSLRGEEFKAVLTSKLSQGNTCVCEAVAMGRKKFSKYPQNLWRKLTIVAQIKPGLPDYAEDDTSKQFEVDIEEEENSMPEYAFNCREELQQEQSAILAIPASQPSFPTPRLVVGKRKPKSVSFPAKLEKSMLILPNKKFLGGSEQPRSILLNREEQPLKFDLQMEKAKLKFWVGQSRWSDALTSQVINQRTCFVDNGKAIAEANSLRESNIRLEKTVKEITPYVIDRLSRRSHAFIQTDDSQDQAKLQELKEKISQMERDKYRQHKVIKSLGSIAHQQLEQIFENRVRSKIEAQIRREGLPDVLMVDQATSECIEQNSNNGKLQSQILEVDQQAYIKSEGQQKKLKEIWKTSKNAENVAEMQMKTASKNRNKLAVCEKCGKYMRSDVLMRHQSGKLCKQ